jgi:hypothetical protein
MAIDSIPHHLRHGGDVISDYREALTHSLQDYQAEEVERGWENEEIVRSIDVLDPLAVFHADVVDD